MGVDDQYLKHKASHFFGVIASTRCHPIWLANGRLVIVALCEDIAVWNLKTGKILAKFHSDGSSPASALALQDQYLAVGYVNGDIKIFSLEKFLDNFKNSSSHDTQLEIYPEMTFTGHNSEVSSLHFSDYNSTQLYLASGSFDSSVIIWDILSEKGLVKFTSHKSHITKVKFCKQNTWLMTASNDCMMKFWDVETNSCFHTMRFLVLTIFFLNKT